MFLNCLCSYLDLWLGFVFGILFVIVCFVFVSFSLVLRAFVCFDVWWFV